MKRLRHLRHPGCFQPAALLSYTAAVSRDDHDRPSPVHVPDRVAGAPLLDASSPRPVAPPSPPPAPPAPEWSADEHLGDARTKGEAAERQRILGLLSAAIATETRPHVRYGLQVAWSLVASQLHPELRHTRR